MAVVFEKPKSLTDAPLHYCPGCTHGIVHRLVAEAIDDLGIERNSEFALEMIYNIIDRRYCIKKPLIVTTNLSYQDMTRADLDMDHQRIYSRLMEMCLPIIYQGQDQRLHEQDIKLEWLKLQQE